MKIDILSDLHVDSHFHQTTPVYDVGKGPQHRDANGDFMYFDFGWYKSPDSDVLVIAGDISNNIAISAYVLRQACKYYSHVVFVDGNHEHHGLNLTYMPCEDIEYSNNVFKNIDILNDFANSIPNLTFLDGMKNASKKIGNVTFVGGCSWYDWSALEMYGYEYEKSRQQWEKFNKDSKNIDFGIYSPEILANEFVTTLEDELAHIQTDVVLVTHSSPLVLLHDIRPTDYHWNLGTGSFINSKVSDVLDDKVKTCIYGHTHDRKDIVIADTRFINNAYGYPKENLHWLIKQIEV